MKLKVNDEEVFELLPWMEKVIKNDIKEEEFEADMKRRARYIWEEKAAKCYERFEKEWIPKLQADPEVTSIPADKEAFINLVTARPDYKNRSQREAEESR